jgi:hypothetical protein
MRRAILSAVLVFPALAQNVPITDVTLRCEPINGTWVAHVTNLSGKNIVHLSLTFTRPGESFISMETGNNWSPVDRFTPPVSDRLDEISTHRGEDGGGPTFPPNTTKDIPLQPADGANPPFIPVIGLVVYADDTAEVANEDTLKRYLEPIQEEVMTLEKENEILAQFASSPNRIADTVAELMRVASESPDPHIRHESGPQVNPDNLLALVRELKQGRWNYQTGKNEQVDPETIIKENAEKLEIESKHLHIKRI